MKLKFPEFDFAGTDLAELIAGRPILVEGADSVLTMAFQELVYTAIKEHRENFNLKTLLPDGPDAAAAFERFAKEFSESLVCRVNDDNEWCLEFDQPVNSVTGLANDVLWAAMHHGSFTLQITGFVMLTPRDIRAALNRYGVVLDDDELVAVVGDILADSIEDAA